jgi:long-subunit fatty acid transport protein
MTKTIKSIMACLLAVLLFTTGGRAQEMDNKKQAQAGFHFLSVVSDARGAAMAEAMTSLETASSSLFFNPAGMANMKGFADASASMNQWIAGINHNAFALALSPAQGEYGVLGFSFQYVDYGTFQGTVVDKNLDQGYADTGDFTLSAMAVGVGYAKRLNDRFSVGGQVRWVRQDLGESVVPEISTALDTTARNASNRLEPLAFDFGTQFKTGFKSLVFGMSVKNFSKEIKYVEEGFQLPLVFNMGVSMDVMDLVGDKPFEQSLIVSIDASHHRDHPEQLKFGFDYTALGMLSLRGGYVTNNDEDGISFGMGISRYGLTLDYTVTPFGVFNEVRRMTARFSL